MDVLFREFDRVLVGGWGNVERMVCWEVYVIILFNLEEKKVAWDYILLTFGFVDQK